MSGWRNSSSRNHSHETLAILTVEYGMELGTPRVEQVWHLKVSPNSRAAHTCNNNVQDVFPKMLMGQETFTSGSAHL